MRCFHQTTHYISNKQALYQQKDLGTVGDVCIF